MLTEVTLHKDLLGFGIWLWSAGHLNILVLNSYVALLVLSNLLFLQYNCQISSCKFFASNASVGKQMRRRAPKSSSVGGTVW